MAGISSLNRFSPPLPGNVKTNLGASLCALAAAFTLGSMIPKELTFSDNLLIAAKRQMAFAGAAGVVFNLANLLLVAAISVAGMAVAFAISFGLGLAIGVALNFSFSSQDNPILRLGGVVLVMVAVVSIAFAHSLYTDAQAAERGAQAGARGKPAVRPPAAALGIVLSAISGLVMSGFYPLIRIAENGDEGVAPYGVAVFVSVGVVLSTLFFIPFFMTFPVQGKPLELREYFTGAKNLHWWGLLAGVIWMGGAVCRFTATNPLGTTPLAPPLSYVLDQGVPLLAMLWGLLAWREFKGASHLVKLLLAGAIVLFAGGVGMITLASLRPR